MLSRRHAFPSASSTHSPLVSSLNRGERATVHGSNRRLAGTCRGGDYVVYNPLTGNTHVLDIVAGKVLEIIMAGPATSAELCQHIAAFLDVPNDLRTAENVDAILAVLDRLGLIEPVAAC